MHEYIREGLFSLYVNNATEETMQMDLISVIPRASMRHCLFQKSIILFVAALQRYQLPGLGIYSSGVMSRVCKSFQAGDSMVPGTWYLGTAVPTRLVLAQTQKQHRLKQIQAPSEVCGRPDDTT